MRLGRKETGFLVFYEMFNFDSEFTDMMIVTSDKVDWVREGAFI